MQLLALDARFRTDCPLLHRRLDYMIHDAEQDHGIVRTITFEAIRERGGYRIAEDGQDRGVRADAVQALTQLYKLVHHRAFGLCPPGAFLHASSGSHGGRRFLLVGGGRTGKTTLITRLAFEDAEVEGDELAIAHGDRVVAFPRRFHLREGIFALVPQLAAMADSLPFHDNENGTKVVSFAPSAGGRRWRIRNGPVDAVFFLEANHGGESRMVPVPRYEMVQHVMTQAAGSGAGRSWIGDVCAVLDRAACYRFTVGRLDNAVPLLLSTIDRGRIG